MTNFVFDVDGTLTPSRGRMDEGFKRFFLKFIKDHAVYLVTGSDYSKTVEQVGVEICESVESVFNCAGNSIWKNGEQVSCNDWSIPKEARDWMNKKLSESKFSLRTGNHIEERPGLVNFSIVGRGCTPEQRIIYFEYDIKTDERAILAKEFNDTFKEMTAQVAGETGLDIIPTGKDKRQIADMIEGPITFFGDKMKHGGNDFPLMVAIEGRPQSGAVEVKDWKHTQKYLQQISLFSLQEAVGMV